MSIERRCVPENKHYVAVKATDLDRLEAEVEALRADAERYRWMKREVVRIPAGWNAIGWDTAIDIEMQADAARRET